MNTLPGSSLNTNGNATNDRLEALERKTRRLGLLCLSQFALLTAIGFAAVYNNHVYAQNSDGVLHARGFVIEDGAGKPRILVGAPFPKVPSRYRQDSTTTAMVFLDERPDEGTRQNV